MKQAMITIEVLVSLLILFMVVATSVTTVKHLNIVRTQQVRYEDIYRAVINIKDYIDADICSKKLSMNGHLNGFEYHAVCKKELENRSYFKDWENNKDGNVGNTMVKLFAVILTLRQDKYKKTYSYQKMITKKLF